MATVRIWCPISPQSRASLSAAALIALCWLPTGAEGRSFQAQPNSATRRFDIPPGPLPASLAAWSAVSGQSVGTTTTLPTMRTHAVRGIFTPAAALDRMLAGTDFRAVRVASGIFRLERRSVASFGAPAPPQARKKPPAPRHSADIVVTATKRPEVLETLPASVSLYVPDRFTTAIASPDSAVVANGIDGLTFTNLGPGRNRAFIRGVADSPFNGPSQSTVAVVLDESRISYDSPDPDLLLLDIDRLEVLKGPQGPLYGSGALGGIYRIVTNVPNLDTTSGATTLVGEAGAHGDLGAGGDALVNLPLVPGKLALRAIGYYRAHPGWLDTTDGAHDTNRAVTKGARLGLRWAPDADWTIDLGGVTQSIDARDSQYVAGLPGRLVRDHPIAEPADNDFAQAHLDIHARLGGLRLVSATSYVSQSVDYRLDATAAAGDFDVAAPAVFADRRHYSIVNQEVRVSPMAMGQLGWVTGLAYLHASSSLDGTITGARAAPRAVESIDRDIAEYAAFGEATLTSGPFALTAGGRLSMTDAADERAERRRPADERHRKLGFAPSLSLSWRPIDDHYFFVRYARAIRPGGLAAGVGASQGHFDSDELDSLEGGARLAIAEGALAIASSVYFDSWHDIQSDYLLDNGLISTRNAGRARIIGSDVSVDWSLGNGWTLRAGGNAERAELVSSADGIRLEDRRLPVVPDVTVRSFIGYRFDLGNWAMRLSGQANYVGHARLSFDPALDRRMGDFAVFSLAATATSNRWSIAVRLDNLLDTAGDSFAFGNPFSIRDGRQYTPLTPRTIVTSVRLGW